MIGRGALTSRSMKRIAWVGLVWLAACAHGPQLADSSGQSANSSGQSGNSSGQSANSSQTSGTSGNSANSSAGSAASSNASAASSDTSNQSSGASNQSNQSSNASTQGSSANSSQSSQNSSSQLAVGSALLSAVVGGIITTVYTVKWRREAKLAKDELERLKQSPAPQPLPYPVQPVPLGPTPVPPPPPVDPGFEPAPYVPPPPKTTELTPRYDAMVQARAWLIANELQLQQDLALGAGPTLEDLAGLAGIAPAHRQRFGRVLQQHRAQLLAPRDVTPEQAAAVLSVVGDLVMTDPVLRPDGLAVLAAW